MDIDHHIRRPSTPPAESSEGHTLSEGAAAMPSPSASQVADALERRIQERKAAEQAAANASYTPFDEEHDKRQEFRRLIDPAILRPNPKNVALESLKVLRHLWIDLCD